MRFQLGEGLLDGVQVWAVWRQGEEPALVSPQRGGGFDVFVGCKVIADHDRSRFDLRDQHLADIGGERFAIHGPFDDPGSNEPIVDKACDECLCWSCRAYVPVSELIYAAFRSNAKGLLPPSDE